MIWRTTSVLLTAIFGWLLIAPVFAANGDANLPACCRKGGRHHCAMSEMASSASVSSGASIRAVPEKCPFYPRATVVAQIQIFTPAAAHLSAIPATAHSSSPQQAEALCRLSFSRSRQKRGPPSLFF